MPSTKATRRPRNPDWPLQKMQRQEGSRERQIAVDIIINMEKYNLCEYCACIFANIIIIYIHHSELPLKMTMHISRSQRGFSLFEVLLFLGILGVILGIAVPMFSQSDAIYAARDRRNAQELSSTCTMAQAAGLNFIQGEDVVAAIHAIVRGGVPAQGAMKGRLFVVPGLSDEDVQGAARYLQILDGELRYTSSVKAHQPGDQKM